MMRTLITALFFIVSLHLPACSPAPRDPWSGLQMNEVQVIGTHNSYKLAIQPELMEAMAKVNRNARSLDYQHLSLTDQLNLGVRNLELDVYWDPEGGRYADPLGNRMLRALGVEPWPVDPDDARALAEPGLKVIHDADFDFRTHHVRLEGALAELAAWTDANPTHVPVVVTVNMKQGRASVPGAVEPAPFDAGAHRAINDALRTTLAHRLLRPDDVRRGHPTLRAALAAGGWPAIDAVRGTYLFVLDHTGETMATYLAEFPNLEGAAFFTASAPGEPTAGVLVVNDPVLDEARIRDLVGRGYLVRTRADAGTTEAREEDLARFEAAQRSGAQVITTDYPIPDRRLSDRYFIRFERGAFVRRNPVVHPARPGVD